MRSGWLGMCDHGKRGTWQEEECTVAGHLGKVARINVHDDEPVGTRVAHEELSRGRIDKHVGRHSLRT